MNLSLHFLRGGAADQSASFNGPKGIQDPTNLVIAQVKRLADILACGQVHERTVNIGSLLALFQCHAHEDRSDLMRGSPREASYPNDGSRKVRRQGPEIQGSLPHDLLVDL